MDKISRSKSSREGGGVVHPPNMHGLRSNSTSTYRYSKEFKAKTSSRHGVSSGFNLDNDLQRKKRVAGYMAYEMEGRVKGSVKKSFRWFKGACNNLVHGFW